MITAACELFPKPRGTSTAFVAVRSGGGRPLSGRAQLPERSHRFRLFRGSIDFLLRHLPGARDPWRRTPGTCFSTSGRCTPRPRPRGRRNIPATPSTGAVEDGEGRVGRAGRRDLAAPPPMSEVQREEGARSSSRRAGVGRAGADRTAAPRRGLIPGVAPSPSATSATATSTSTSASRSAPTSAFLKRWEEVNTVLHEVVLAGRHCLGRARHRKTQAKVSRRDDGRAISERNG